MIEMKKYTCEICGPIHATHTEVRNETYPVKGENIAVNSLFRICDTCDAIVYDRELDSAALLMAFDIYRAKHGLITPDEIVHMRTCYGLSQRNLATLIGVGEASINRYENGSLPDSAHSQLLQFAQNSLNMLELLNKNGHKLTGTISGKVRERVIGIIESEKSERLAKLISSDHVDEFTGFKEFAVEILKEMMVFFAKECNGIFKTKLMKLVWYSDFLHYRSHSVSITGATYIHLPYGPVPDNFAIFLSDLEKIGAIKPEEEYRGDRVFELLRASRDPNRDVFSADAIAIMNGVMEYFRDVGSNKISDISHEEVAYTDTSPGQKISYKYAELIQIQL